MNDSLLGVITDADLGPRRSLTPQEAIATMRGVPAEQAKQTDEDRFIAKLIKGLGEFYSDTTLVAALPAHNAPHFYSLPIDVSARVTVPAAVGDWQTITQYQLENGRGAVINAYGFDVADNISGAYTYDGSLLFRVLINGVAVHTLDSFGTHRGSVTEPRKTFIRLTNNSDLVRLQVKRAVASAAAHDVDGVLVGHTWRPTVQADGSAASLAY